DSYVTRAMWLGARVLVRACTSRSDDCAAWLVDPKTGKSAHIAGLNIWGLEDLAFQVKDDLWALVDGHGKSVVFVHEADGKIEKKLELPAPPDLRFRLGVGRRTSTGAPSPQLWFAHGGTARVMLVDLASAQIAANYLPPLCGERVN